MRATLNGKITPEYQRHTYYNNHVRALFNRAKSRARERNIEFTITLSDLKVPTHCPILGVPIVMPVGPHSGGLRPRFGPSIDRTDPRKGYVKGNVAIISQKANTMKSDNTLETARALVRYLEERIQNGHR